ncbi:MAG: HetP family heterocyst commitment protein [Leptolyngbyaceae cyanobacterium]
MVFNTERMKASMSEEEFSLIIDAILNGKYSWACVLILKNAGYEPGHYIPYRTLNRLIKENGFPSCTSAPTCQSKSHSRSLNNRSKRSASARSLRDLTYLELIANESTNIKGGNFAAWANVNKRLKPAMACSTVSF